MYINKLYISLIKYLLSNNFQQKIFGVTSFCTTKEDQQRFMHQRTCGLCVLDLSFEIGQIYINIKGKHSHMSCCLSCHGQQSRFVGGVRIINIKIYLFAFEGLQNSLQINIPKIKVDLSCHIKFWFESKICQALLIRSS